MSIYIHMYIYIYIIDSIIMNIHPSPFFFCGTYSLWAGLGVAHRSNHHPHVFSCAPQILITWKLVSNGFHIHLWCDGNYWADGEIYVISSPSSPMSQGKWTESRFKWLKILAWIRDCSFQPQKIGIYTYIYRIYTVPLNGWDDTRSTSNGSERRAGWRWIHIPGDPQEVLHVHDQARAHVGAGKREVSKRTLRRLTEEWT